LFLRLSNCASVGKKNFDNTELHSPSHTAGTAKQQFTTMRSRSYNQIVSLSVQSGYAQKKYIYKYPGTENSCLPVFQHSKQLGPWRQPPPQHDFHDNAHVVVMHADRQAYGRADDVLTVEV
jgi:hypothetical protein